MTSFWIYRGCVYFVQVVIFAVTSRVVSYAFFHDHRLTLFYVMEHPADDCRYLSMTVHDRGGQ
jgi:hypothetical protein